MGKPDPEFEPPEEPELLSLGLMGGGSTPHNELVCEAFLALMRGVQDRTIDYPNEGLRINIVYHVPGWITRPDFEGVFPARYARKTSHLLVNAAVPESLKVDDVREFFVESLKETKVAVADYLRKRNIHADTTAVMNFIDDLVSERAAS